MNNTYNVYIAIQNIQNLIIQDIQTKIQKWEDKNKILNKLKQKFQYILNDQETKLQEPIQNLSLVMHQRLYHTLKKIKQEQYELEVNIFCFGNLAGPLPIYELRCRMTDPRDFIQVVQAAAGSGKTLLYPLMLMQHSDIKYTFLTQPDTYLVHTTINKLNEIYGEQIAYSIKEFGDFKGIFVCTPHELIDLLVQNMFLIDLSRFMIDEYHTRTVQQDIIMALLIQNKILIRIPAQIVLMSATPDQKIDTYLEFHELNIDRQCQDGTRPFKVQQIHRNAFDIRDACVTQPASICEQVLTQMQNKGTVTKGNILCFTSGNCECEFIIKSLMESKIDGITFVNQDIVHQYSTIQTIHQFLRDKATDDKLLVIPVILTGKSTVLETQFAVQPVPYDIKTKCIKLIIATNVVENSITIDNLVIIIDSGIFKEKYYDYSKDTSIQTEKIISKSSREQRVGRIGRVCPGIAYLIDIDNKQASSGLPEILRIELRMQILKLKSMDIDIENINQLLPQPIDQVHIQNMLQNLCNYKLLNYDYSISELGMQISQYDTSGLLQSLIIEQSRNTNQVSQFFVLLITQILVQNNFPHFEDIQSGYIQQFYCVESDFVTLFSCFIGILQECQNKNQEQIVQFFQDNKINTKHIRFIQEQLQQQLIKLQLADQNSTVQEINQLIINNTIQCSKQLIFAYITEYIRQLTDMREYIRVGLGKKYFCLFKYISNIEYQPQQVFEVQSQQNTNRIQAQLCCFKRIGSRIPETFNQVYFGSIQYNQKKKMFIGKYQHKMSFNQGEYPIQTIYRMQQDNTDFQNTHFFNLISNIYYANQQLVQPMYNQQHPDNNIRNQVFMAKGDLNNLYYCVCTQLSELNVADLKQQLSQLKTISLNSPYSIISKYNEKLNIMFSIEDNSSIVTQLFQDNEKYAYQLNYSTLRYMMSNFKLETIQQLHFCLIIGLKNVQEGQQACNDFNNIMNYNLDALQSFNVYDVINNEIQVKLVIVSNRQRKTLQSLNCQLSWQCDIYSSLLIENDENTNDLKFLETDQIRLEQTREFIFYGQGQQILLATSANENGQLSKLLNTKQIDIFDKKYNQIDNQINQFKYQLNDTLMVLFNILKTRQIEASQDEIIFVKHIKFFQTAGKTDYTQFKQRLVTRLNDANAVYQEQDGSFQVSTTSQLNPRDIARDYLLQVCELQLVNIYINEFDAEDAILAGQFGCFEKQIQKQNNCTLVQMRTIQAARAFLQKINQRNVSLHQLVPSHFYKNLQVQQYVNSLFIQHNFNIILQQTGFVATPDEMRRFSSFLKKREISFELPICEIPFYGADCEEVIKLTFTHKNATVDLARRIVLTPISQKQYFEEKIGNLCENASNDVICLNTCDRQIPHFQKIVFYENKAPKCKSVCVPCFQQLLRHDSKDGLSSLRISENGGPLGLNVIALSFAGIEIQRILVSALKAAVLQSGNYKRCDNCSILIQKGADSTFWCGACKLLFCNVCQKYQQQQHHCTEQQLPPGVKRCPQCSVPTMKTDGCDHMTCKMCKKHWCFRCGSGPYESENDTHAHMRQAHPEQVPLAVRLVEQYQMHLRFGFF